jgi:hypothetical protein
MRCSEPGHRVTKKVPRSVPGADSAFSTYALDPASGTVFFRLMTPLKRPTSRLPLETRNGTVGA